MSFQQDRSRYDLQAGTSRREKLESSTRPQPVAESYPRCKVHRRNRGRQIASSNRCRLTRSSPRFSDSSSLCCVDIKGEKPADRPYCNQRNSNCCLILKPPRRSTSCPQSLLVVADAVIECDRLPEPICADWRFRCMTM